MPRVRFAFLAACALAACSSNDTTTGVNGPQAQLNFVNGVSQASAVEVRVDGHLAASVSTPGALAPLTVTAGSHNIEVRGINGGSYTSGTLNGNYADGRHYVLVAVPAGTALSVTSYGDSNTVVPANQTKLRVIHAAQSAPSIDIWRTQPDYQTPIRVMFPFAYGAASPYLQSDPGDWRVLVSSPVIGANDPMPDTLTMTPAITIPAGSSRTVVVVDGAAGGLTATVVEP